MVSKSLTWNGDAVSKRWKDAQVAAVNATMGAAVQHAKRNHPWRNRTGLLEGSINVLGYAMPTATGVEGHWGVNDAVQARMLEVGGVITAKNAEALAIPLPGGGVVFRRSVVIPAYPYLRPAGDATYPTLANRIRKAHDKIGGGND
jgi:hypothetical protein